MDSQTKSQATIFVLNWVPGGGKEEGYAEDLDGVGGVGPAAHDEVEVVEAPEAGGLYGVLVVARHGVAVVLGVLGSDLLFLKHDGRILRLVIQPCMWFLHDGKG